MENIIDVLGLKKSYQNTSVLNGLDVKIKKGECYGLLGANGAGKSTTIESILGIKTIDSGIIRIVEELCLETQCLYNTPIDYKILLEQFDLSTKKNAYVKELSGGQQQKLFIVLALIPNPKVVFLDELTTGLDLKSRRYDDFRYCYACGNDCFNGLHLSR